MKDILVKRKPNPFTYNGGCVVVLDRWKGTIFELEGELAAIYELLDDEYKSVGKLSALYKTKYNKPLNPVYIEKLKDQEGLVDVRAK